MAIFKYDDTKIMMLIVDDGDCSYLFIDVVGFL